MLVLCSMATILHCFWDMARYWSKMADFNLPTSNLAPLWGGLDVISPRYFAPENYSPWATVWRCLRDPAFSRFGIVPACDRQTDRKTHDDSIHRASIKSRGDNCYYYETENNCSHWPATVIEPCETSSFSEVFRLLVRTFHRNVEEYKNTRSITTVVNYISKSSFYLQNVKSVYLFFYFPYAWAPT